MNRRTLLVGALAATSSIAGCLDSTTNSATEATSTGTDSTESPTTEASTGSSTTEDPTTVRAVDAPDPDHAIWVENETDSVREITVTVTRIQDGEPDEVVYEATHELEPKGSKYVYNLNESNPDGVERFEVAGETGDQTTWRYVATSECYLDCGIVLREGGELVVERPIC